MSQKSLVLELQKFSTDKSYGVTDLLRKALLVASKLNIEEFKSYITKELHGYETNDVPAYRKVRAELKAKSPYYGLIPFIINNNKFQDMIEYECIRDPIGSIEDLLINKRDKDNTLILSLTTKQIQILLDLQENYEKLQPVRVVGRNQLANIIESVRTVILEWSLRLESEGILGESLIFTESEKEKASSSPQIRINNFQGILGDVSNSEVMQNLKMHILKEDFKGLSEYLKSLGINDNEISELKSAINTDPIPKNSKSFGKNVSSWLGKILGKAANGLLNVGVNKASNLLSSALMSYYGIN